MMRRVNYIFILFAVFCTLRAGAQEIDHTQYYLNLPGSNAGFTGIEDYMDTRFSFRQGWNDFAVRNNYAFVSAYGALNNFARTALTNNTLRLSDPDQFRQVQNEKKLMRKHGVGGMITSREFGPYKATTINANYAYHLPVAPGLNMAFGTRIGFNGQRIDLTNYTLRDQVNDDFYNSIVASGQGNSGNLMMDFGYVLYSSRFYAGISTNGLISTHIAGTTLVELEQVMRVSFQGALTHLPLSSDLTFSPATRITYAPGYDVILSGNGRLRYKNLVYVGAGYTNNSPRLSLLFGLNVNGRFSVNYSYDKYLSDLNNFSVNVHEFVIGAALFNRYNAATKLW